MKVYRVVTERDGKTIKAPGVTETEMKREEYRYAANTIDGVWKHAVQRFIDDPECTVIEVHEEHPSITILIEEQREGFFEAFEDSHAATNQPAAPHKEKS